MDKIGDSDGGEGILDAIGYMSIGRAEVPIHEKG